jgi:Fic family protein
MSFKNEHPRNKDGKFIDKDIINDKGKPSGLNKPVRISKKPPYSLQEYEKAYEKSFGENGYFKKMELKPFFSKLNLSNTAEKINLKRIDTDTASKKYKKNFDAHITNLAEVEGFSTTNFELLEMMNTDDLSNYLENGTMRISTIAGITEAFKQIGKQINSHSKLDISFLKKLNKFVAYPTLRDKSGYLRGEKKPNLSVYVRLDENNVFIPVLPKYAINNLENEIIKKIKSLDYNNVNSILELEPFLVYGQFFPDGNTRSARLFMDAHLIKAGYIPPILPEWERKEWILSKNKLLKTADMTQRVKMLADLMQ